MEIGHLGHPHQHPPRKPEAHPNPIIIQFPRTKVQVNLVTDRPLKSIISSIRDATHRVLPINLDPLDRRNFTINNRETSFNFIQDSRTLV